MNVAEAISQTLVAEGIDTVFSLLGEATMHVVSHLASQGVRVVECRHEAAAMAMADGYSRASGRPALCAVTTGPALSHTLTPLTSASRTASSVVVLTGLRSLDDLEDRQRMDHQGIARIAGANYLPLLDPNAAVERTRAALDMARYERKPVVFDVAEEVQVQDFAWDVESRATPAWQQAQRVHPDPDVLDRVVEMLRAAERPVILAGGGVLASGAREELIALGEECGALLTTSLNAKTLFDGDPYNAGVAGLYSSDPVMERFATSDLVLSFGAGLNSFTLAKGYLFGNAAIVQIDVRPPQPMDSGLDADQYLQADALAAATSIRRELAAAGGVSGSGFRDSETAAALRQPIDPVEIEVGADELDPRKLCAELDAILPASCGFVSGLSGHFWNFGALHMTRRRQPMLSSTYVGSIGYGVPVGLGAALADPDRPLMIFEGDGSLMLNVHTLETAARQNLRVLIVVANNESLGAEYFSMHLKGLDRELSMSRGLDVAAIASAMGCRSTVATNMQQVREFAQEFLDGDGPYVLDARTSLNVMSRTYRRAKLGE